MRRTVYACALVFVLVLVLLALHGIPLAVLAGPPTGAGRNGDVNGDGNLDIGDAVHLLFHIFKGGPAPVACADSPELVERVAAVERIQLAMEDALQRLVSGVEEIARPCRERRDRFLSRGDGTVTDTCTDLMWTAVSVDLNGDAVSDALDQMEWDEVRLRVDDLSLAGHDDWRLPTILEFTDIVMENWSPAIDPAFGTFNQPRPGQGSAWYWSGSVSNWHSGYAWAVNVYEDLPSPRVKRFTQLGKRGLTGYALAVRSGAN